MLPGILPFAIIICYYTNSIARNSAVKETTNGSFA